MRSFFKISILNTLVFILFITSIPYSNIVGAAGSADCLQPYSYKHEAEKARAQNYAKQLGISQVSNGKNINIGFLLNKCGIGEAAVVYGNPTHSALINSNTFDQGQWRYLGWDNEGNLYRNWKFRSDSRATLHVAKNWVKFPWDTSIGISKKIILTEYSNNNDLAASWLHDMADPYGESKTFLQSYNKRKGTNWTGDDLLDYAIIQQPRTQFSPGVVQMWNIWEPDGSWWYEMFTIPPPDLPEYQELPDLVITNIVTDPVGAAAASWVGDSVTIKITTKNEGETNSGPFTVGFVGSSNKSEVISNVPPGQIKTVTLKVSSAVSGIIKYTAMTDFGAGVVESIENNNTKPFQIVFSKKNEPTAPIAIISHTEGDHRTTPEIFIKPSTDPALDDKLSYSSGKEPITLYEWKYKTPTGNTINKKPIARDFTNLGEYLVELRVTNSKNKVSDWAQLIVNVAVTPKPTATPLPTAPPEPTPTPKRPIKVDITFNPIAIFTGEQSSLENRTINWVDYTWTFSPNLTPLIPNASDFEHGPITFNEPGIYSATLTATDEHGFSETKTAYLSVNDPKPTAIISGVSRWIQGRPFPAPHHLNNSYTPLASRGTTIDWNRSEMRYKKDDGSDYQSGWPTIAPMDLGHYVLEGKVYDSFGRMSEWATHPLEIVPDEPPTVEITVPDEGVRNNEVMLYIDALSLDGDDITSLKIEERYDSNGDGNFEDQTWKVIYEGINKFTHTVKYTSVGKRQYRAVAKESFGLSAISNLDEINIINMAPVTNFNVFGTIQQPDQGEDSSPPVTNYTPETILRSWQFKKPYSGGNENKAGWKVSGTNLMTRNSVWADFGGDYNLATNLRPLPAWEGTVGKIYPGYKTLIVAQSGYYRETSSGYINETPWRFIVKDARTGKVQEDYTHPAKTFGIYLGNDFINSTYREDLYTGDINTGYFTTWTRDGVRGAGLRLYNIKTGELLQDYPDMTAVPPLGWNDNIDPSYNMEQIIFSEDKKYAYVVSQYTNGEANYSMRWALYLTKYSLHQKTAVWTVLLGQQDEIATVFRSQPAKIDKNGNLNITFYFRGAFQNEKFYTSNYHVYDTNGVRLRGYGMSNALYTGIVASADKSKMHATVTSYVSGYYGYSRNVGLLTYDVGSNGFNQVDLVGNTLQDIEYPDYFNMLPAVNKFGLVSLYNGAIVSPNGSINTQHPSSVSELLNKLILTHNTNPDYMSKLPSFYYTMGQAIYNGERVFSKIIAQPSGDFFTIYAGLRWKYRYTPATETGLANHREVSYQRLSTVLSPNQNELFLSNESDQWFIRYNGGTSSFLGSEYIDSTKVAPDGSLFLNTVDYYDLQFGHRKMVVPLVGESTGELPRLVDDNTVEVDSETWGGLLYDPVSVMRNQMLEFNVSANSMTNDKIIGAGIRIKDEKNLYAVEWSQDTLILYRVVNGSKAELARSPLARPVGIPYAFKIEAIGSTIRVIVNNMMLLEATDSTYATGSAGLLSVGQQMASFNQVKRTNYGNSYPQNTYDAVLVNDPISYEKLFQDVEIDPMGTEEWSYTHNPNFFENPEGISVHHGKTYTSTINTLEKAGLYEITFRAQDDPGLASYRKWSQPVNKIIYAHRRPIAQPDVRFTGRVFADGEALDYETFDTSYDPDISHILSDKLFRTRYADESTWTKGKRELYNRPGVELIVQEQVRDIHGAWSYWGQSIVYKDALPPINQTKPMMTITSPAGTTAATPTVLVKEPTIRWTYFDAQNDPQEKYRLTLTYVDTNETALYIEHEGNALTYQMLEESIIPGRVVKVQGQVSSTGVWSNVSNSRYFVLDLPPETFLIWPNGPNADNPIYIKQNRPQLRVFTVDPENHPITAIDYEVFRASTGENVVDTNSSTSAASYTTAALAEGLHNWRARANDSYLWGPYSSNGFFFVDTVKPNDVDEQLVIEPTAVTVSFNVFSDAEPSSGHASRTFFLQKVNADGSITVIDLNKDGSSEYSIPLAHNKLSYRVDGLVAGQEYRMTVVDHDVAGNEGHYAYIHFVTNRPPTGYFDWSPNPVFEGDTVLFNTKVDDADKNILDITYEITNPSGSKNNYSYVMNVPYPTTGPTIRMTGVGTWTVKMTVSDRIAEPVVFAKTIQVLPLHVTGYVRHTELWDQHRKAFNLKQSGKEDEPRGYSVFWAGEKFVLHADTALTSTITKADRVEVQMSSYETTLLPATADQSIWKGELWNATFADLAEGKLTFTFTAYYNNGIIKTNSVDVTIEGQALEITGVHRMQ